MLAALGRSGCILAHISMNTRARDFKFARTVVQRLYLVMVMVALTNNRWSAQYGCKNTHEDMFLTYGCSHLSTNCDIFGYAVTA